MPLPIAEMLMSRLSVSDENVRAQNWLLWAVKWLEGELAAY